MQETSEASGLAFETVCCWCFVLEQFFKEFSCQILLMLLFRPKKSFVFLHFFQAKVLSTKGQGAKKTAARQAFLDRGSDSSEFFSKVLGVFGRIKEAKSVIS